jgi:hypothetical protein
MTLHELALMVQEMRAAQKTYFQTRHQYDLAKSKQLERELDATVKDLLERSSCHQPSLFGEGDDVA